MNLDTIRRLETSIDFINDGLTFTVGNFVLGRSTKGRIFVNGYVNYIRIENISKTRVREDFEEMKKSFLELMAKSQQFSEFANSKGLDYYLLVDTGSAGVKPAW